MSFLSQSELVKLKGKLCSEPRQLGKLFKARKAPYYERSVSHSEVDEFIKEGWIESARLKTKTKLRKDKPHDKLFEDQIWCQLYKLGYRCLNYDDQFRLPFGKDEQDKKQIDVIAVNGESVLLVECKSKEKPAGRAPSFKSDFEALPSKLGGFRKAVDELFHRGIKLKYIFATHNLRLDPESADIQRLLRTNSFYYNDNTYKYVNYLIEKYKAAAHYQFQGIIFRGEKVTRDKIELPAIEGNMGGKKYYMFSIEPQTLLRIGFILHRTEANESETPTYQRLLVPSRLKGITAYIDDGGYFPNSVILNFNQKAHRLQFDPDARGDHSQSRTGKLKIPNAYAFAYVIDGQHRLYGYAGSKRRDSNTIPVVAFVDLKSSEQLRIFMDINENQKAVSASLRLTLEEDLYWESERLDSRIKALRSSVIRVLGSDSNGVLYKKIQIGEDKAPLSSKPFADALLKSGLLPRARGNKFSEESSIGAIYDTGNHDYTGEMLRSRKEIVALINLCYLYVEEDFNDIFERDRYFIVANRGTFAYISLIGSLNEFETQKGTLSRRSSPEERFQSIKKYLTALLAKLRNLNKEEAEKLLDMRGQQVETRWLRAFQNYVHEKYPNYAPPELVDWQERQDDELQDRGAKYGIAIEKHMKRTIMRKLKQIYGENWDLEIGDIKAACERRASDEIQKQYKEGLGRKEIAWTEMFFVLDYKKIIEDHWTKRPPEDVEGFRAFEKEFALDMGLGPFNSKSDKVKWISVFNSYRNLWAHEATREKRLNREEVGFLEKIHERLIGRN